MKQSEIDSNIAKNIAEIEENATLLVNYFSSIMDSVSDEAYWCFLRSVWIKCGEDNPFFRDCFYRTHRTRQHKIMKSTDRQILRKLPKELTIYRAPRKKEVDPYKRINWTADYSVAEKFANTYQNGIISRKIRREDIFAYFTSRQEAEVILKEKALIF